MSWNHLPEIIQWDITSGCNLKCAHCRAGFLNSGNDLDTNQALLMIKKLYYFAPEAVLAVAGGEPLFRNDLKEILAFAKNIGFNIEILTNATLISSTNIPWLCETINGFNVSMEGASAEAHDKIRGNGSFEKTVKALELLTANQSRISIRMTYLSQGEKEPEKLLRFVAKMGIDFFNFRYLVPVEKARGRKIDSDQYRRLCRKLLSIGKELNVSIGFSDPFPEILLSDRRQSEIKKDRDLIDGNAVTGCSAGFYLFYLDHQGIIRLCPYLPAKIADAKGDLKTIWFNNELLNLFRSHHSLLKGKCATCEYKFACGGCRGAAWGTDGDFLGEDIRCWKK